MQNSSQNSNANLYCCVSFEKDTKSLIGTECTNNAKTNDLSTKKISAAHRKLQALIAADQLEDKECKIEKNQCISLFDSPSTQKTK